MKIVKKLTFAPLFLISFGFLIYQLNMLLSSDDIIFSLSLSSLIQAVKISLLLLSTGLFFSLFVTLAADWRMILPTALLGGFAPFLFVSPDLTVIFVVTILLSLLLTYLSLEESLKTYFTFQSTALLGPSIRRFSTLLILSFCIIYFLSINKVIAQNGFQIPDSIIDTALKMTPAPVQQTQLPDIPAEQLDFLKKNPQLLKQYGIDPKLLETTAQPTSNVIKKTVKDQLQNFLKPYQSFIPAILAILLFLSLQSLISILSLLIYPLLWLIFFILEKTGFVKFEIEQRPVKKLIV